ncbi:MAG TPA: hypothetical protein VF821_24635 [Lentzea sp.]
MADDFLPERPSAWNRPEPLPMPDLGIVAPIVFLAGLIATIVCALSLPTTLDVIAERGPHGVYVIADEPSCGPDRCRTHLGTFTSDDKTVVRSGVGLAGSPLESEVRTGRVRAFDVGDSEEVYLEGASGPGTVFPLLFGAGGVIVMVYGLRSSVREWRRKREGPGA